MTIHQRDLAAVLEMYRFACGGSTQALLTPAVADALAQAVLLIHPVLAEWLGQRVADMEGAYPLGCLFGRLAEAIAAGEIYVLEAVGDEV